MEMLNVKVNGIAVSVPKGATILEAEGNKQRVILEAEAVKKATVLEAEAEKEKNV